MKAGLELSDIPEGFLIPVVAALGVVGNLGNSSIHIIIDKIGEGSGSWLIGSLNKKN